MNIDPRIFREYDIRGIAGQEFSSKEIETYEKWYGPFPGITLTRAAALAVGKAYGTMIRQNGGKSAVVGYEVRPFAKELKDAFIEGIRSTGCKVFDAQISTTPLIYFATAFFGLDGGTNVTGSHNVYFYNGFKLMKKDVWPLFGKELQKMREIIEQEAFVQDTLSTVETLNIFQPYLDYVLSHVKLSRNIRMVIDAGNGSAGAFASQTFRALGCQVTELYCEPDARFPHHVPDPEAPQNMRDLAREVLTNKAEVGVAFDADGDRVGFVDERGEFVSADLALLVFAKDVLTRHRGKKILYDVKCSQLLEDLIPQYGGIPFMHRTGHAPIKETLRQDLDIILGGEVSGHFYMAEDYFRIDDGLWSAVKMMEIFSRSQEPFSSLFSEIPFRVRTPEIKLPCRDERKFEIIEKIKQDFQSRFDAITIDGIRIKVSATGWGLVRASNTSPYLTLRIEGKSKEEVLQIKTILADELEKFPEIGDRLDRNEVAVLKGRLGWV